MNSVSIRAASRAGLKPQTFPLNHSTSRPLWNTGPPPRAGQGHA